MKHNSFEKITKLVKKKKKKMKKAVFPAGLEPATFCVLSRRDNHYTTETTLVRISLLPSTSSNPHFTSLSHCVYRGSGAAVECSYFTKGFVE